MKRAVIVLVGALVAVVAALAVAAPVQAHNYLVSSTPAANQTLTTLPPDFVVTTNGVLLNLNKDGSGFAIQVRDAKGLYYGDGCVKVDGATISMPAAIGQPGPYTVTWQVISTDGHTVSDTFAFGWAGSGTPSVGQKAPPTCHGKYHFSAGGLPAVGTGTGSQSVADGTLVTVLWIGGAVLAVGAAVVVTLLVTSRKRRSA